MYIMSYKISICLHHDFSLSDLEEINLTPNPYIASANRKRSSTGSVSSQREPSLNNSHVSQHSSVVGKDYITRVIYLKRTGQTKLLNL